MRRDPVTIPRSPGVYALVNKKRRYAYIAFSANMQKRSHSMSYMLQNPETWAIAQLPIHPAEEWTFMVVKENVEPEAAQRVIKATTKEFTERNYSVVGGGRSAVPTIDFEGTKVTLVDAIARSGCKDQYITVWRRLKRGWTVNQALGIDEPPARWDPEQVKARRQRAAQAA